MVFLDSILKFCWLLLGTTGETQPLSPGEGQGAFTESAIFAADFKTPYLAELDWRAQKPFATHGDEAILLTDGVPTLPSPAPKLSTQGQVRSLKTPLRLSPFRLAAVKKSQPFPPLSLDTLKGSFEGVQTLAIQKNAPTVVSAVSRSSRFERVPLKGKVIRGKVPPKPFGPEGVTAEEPSPQAKDGEKPTPPTPEVPQETADPYREQFKSTRPFKELKEEAERLFKAAKVKVDPDRHVDMRKVIYKLARLFPETILYVRPRLVPWHLCCVGDPLGNFIKAHEAEELAKLKTTVEVVESKPRKYVDWKLLSTVETIAPPPPIHWEFVEVMQPGFWRFQILEGANALNQGLVSLADLDARQAVDLKQMLAQSIWEKTLDAMDCIQPGSWRATIIAGRNTLRTGSTSWVDLDMAQDEKLKALWLQEKQAQIPSFQKESVPTQAHLFPAQPVVADVPLPDDLEEMTVVSFDSKAFTPVLGQIRSGNFPLKNVDSAALPLKEEPSRNQMLAAIRKGVALQPVPVVKKRSPKKSLRASLLADIHTAAARKNSEAVLEVLAEIEEERKTVSNLSRVDTARDLRKTVEYFQKSGAFLKAAILKRGFAMRGIGDQTPAPNTPEPAFDLEMLGDKSSTSVSSLQLTEAQQQEARQAGRKANEAKREADRKNLEERPKEEEASTDQPKTNSHQVVGGVSWNVSLVEKVPKAEPSPQKKEEDSFALRHFPVEQGKKPAATDTSLEDQENRSSNLNVPKSTQKTGHDPKRTQNKKGSITKKGGQRSIGTSLYPPYDVAESLYN